MTPEQFRKVEQLFHRLREMPPEQRVATLDAECRDDPEVLEEIQKLFPNGNLESTLTDLQKDSTDALQPPQERLDEPLDAFTGRCVGPYRLKKLIATGGMGSIYLATREDEFQQQVAVKLIKRGMDTDEILRRFRHERQVLAALEHPNISRLLDGGSTEDGLPYFVMEYIEGKPIDVYCDEHRLSTLERLRLFREVCAAVHFAHQNTVIHRDLKPRNVLVTPDGTPKLVDFGIAKLTNRELGFQTLDYTRTEFRFMTPEYASPEQVRGDTITTASDVYSLGIVLYELLTGHRPYELTSRLKAEIERIVCEQDPPLPSEVVARPTTVHKPDGKTETLTPETLSELRGGDLRTLRRRLRGDLDNIVLMCLRKEPWRRYQSAEQLASDIERHVNHEPVLAARPNTTYRLRKLLRRHRGTVGATLAVFLTLAIGLVAATLMYLRADAAERRAQHRFDEVRRLATTLIFEFPEKIENVGGTTRAREFLVTQALQYLGSLAAEVDDPSLAREVGMAYMKVGDVQGGPHNANLGDTTGALRSYTQSLAILDKLHQASPQNAQAQRDMAIVYERMGDIHAALGDTGAAAVHYQRELEFVEKLARAEPNNGEAQLDLARAHARTGVIQTNSGQSEAALQSYQRAAKVARDLVNREPNNVQARRYLADDYAHMGELQLLMGRSDEALASVQKNLEICEALARLHPENAEIQRDLLIACNKLGYLEDAIGQFDAARAHFERALKMAQTLVQIDPANAQAQSDVCAAHVNVGSAQATSGENEQALASYLAAQEIALRLAEADPSNVQNQRNLAINYEYVADAQAALGRTSEALAGYQKNLEILRRLCQQDVSNDELQYDQARSLDRIGGVQATLNQAEDALRTHQEALRVYQALAKADPSSTRAQRGVALSLEQIGNIQAAVGDFDAAFDSYQRSLDIRETLVQHDPNSAVTQRDVAGTHFAIGFAHARLGADISRSAAQRSASWRQARAEYQLCLDGFTRMRDRGVLAPADVGEVTHLAAEIAQCSAAIADLEQPPQPAAEAATHSPTQPSSALQPGSTRTNDEDDTSQ